MDSERAVLASGDADNGPFFVKKLASWKRDMSDRNEMFCGAYKYLNESCHKNRAHSEYIPRHLIKASEASSAYGIMK